MPLRYPLRTGPRRVMGRRRGRLALWPLLLFAAFFAYYYFSHQEEVPLTGRSQLVDLDREQEMALGLQAYQEILRQSDVVSEPELVQPVREIGRRLATVVEKDPGFEWEFNLLRSEQANAFALPGGKVAVYTGLLPIARNADGLAVGEMDYETQRMVMAALGVGTQYGILLPFSRQHESEADYIGLIYTVRACFDPRGAPRLWERMPEALAVRAEFCEG